jgi:hypothetical protein
MALFALSLSSDWQFLRYPYPNLLLGFDLIRYIDRREQPATIFEADYVDGILIQGPTTTPYVSIPEKNTHGSLESPPAMILNPILYNQSVYP